MKPRFVNLITGKKLQKITRYGYPYCEDSVGPIELQFDDISVVFDILPDGQTAIFSYTNLSIDEGEQAYKKVVVTEIGEWQRLVGQIVVDGEIIIDKTESNSHDDMIESGYQVKFSSGDVFNYFNNFDDATISMQDILPNPFSLFRMR